jgi:SNF2 family DNA or RNA helicase
MLQSPTYHLRQLILKAIMLRRIKSEIPDLNLPPRTVQIEECEFEESEQFVYDQLRAIAEEKIDKAIEVTSIESHLCILLSVF